MLTVFLPTPILGVYQHAERKTYHLRNERTGRMIYTPYTTIEQAAEAQRWHDSRPEWPHYAQYIHVDSDLVSLDDCLFLLDSEVRAWGHLAEHPLLQTGLKNSGDNVLPLDVFKRTGRQFAKENAHLMREIEVENHV